MSAILSPTYFGPVQWFQKFCLHQHTEIDMQATFLKQTFRNRCVIAGPNGQQALTVPVEHGTGKDIRISSHGNWPRLHWNALQTAYGDSPFFLYYADDIRPFFEQRFTFLYDLDLAITLKLLELLDLGTERKEEQETHGSVVFENPSASNSRQAATDFRHVITPKHPRKDAEFHPRPYYQVYQNRNGFLPNLSILDLLFNMGNESVFWLFK